MDAFRFKGFLKPKQNWSKLPNEITQNLSKIRSGELKVILYILRHTWGYQEYDIVKHITMDEFQYGRMGKDGTRMDGGTGLSMSSVRRAVKQAILHGFVDVEVDDRDRGRIKKKYKLAMRIHPKVGPSRTGQTGYTGPQSDRAHSG